MNLNNNTVSVTDTNGNTMTYTYDAANRVSQSTQGTQSIGYSYNIPAGTRTITYPSGRVISAVVRGVNSPLLT
jgi:YD repeat-containing protein